MPYLRRTSSASIDYYTAIGFTASSKHTEPDLLRSLCAPFEKQAERHDRCFMMRLHTTTSHKATGVLLADKGLVMIDMRHSVIADNAVLHVSWSDACCPLSGALLPLYETAL
eukprot:18888-Heterococcus_DN1.PRE.9